MSNNPLEIKIRKYIKAYFQFIFSLKNVAPSFGNPAEYIKIKYIKTSPHVPETVSKVPVAREATPNIKNFFKLCCIQIPVRTVKGKSEDLSRAKFPSAFIRVLNE